MINTQVVELVDGVQDAQVPRGRREAGSGHANAEGQRKRKLVEIREPLHLLRRFLRLKQIIAQVVELVDTLS